MNEEFKNKAKELSKDWSDNFLDYHGLILLKEENIPKKYLSVKGLRYIIQKAYLKGVMDYGQISR